MIEKNEDVLYELLEFTAINNIQFFVNVGIADGFGPNEWIDFESKHVLNTQFSDIQVQLPNYQDYELSKWIQVPILKDYDKSLRERQLQLSYIDDEHYDYLAVIHKISDYQTLMKVFKRIGYRWFKLKWEDNV